MTACKEIKLEEGGGVENDKRNMKASQSLKKAYGVENHDEGIGGARYQWQQKTRRRMVAMA